jgi:F0F1-type ATP synthase epsilon subunit
MILRVTSAEWQLYNWPVDKVLLPTDHGIIGILPWHMNIATTLIAWVVSIEPTHQATSALDSFAPHGEKIQIDGWLATIEHDVITVVVE